MPHYVLDARTAAPHFPGIGRYVTNLARALVPLLAPDERLSVIFDPAHPLSLPDDLGAHVIPATASPFSLRQQLTIPRLLRALHADLYHSAYYLMPYRVPVPTLLTVYDLIPILFPRHSTLRARLLFRLTCAQALRAADRSVAISEATRQDFLRHFPIGPEDIVTIPLAADPVFRPQPAEATAALRRRYGLPDGFYLYLGSNKPHKNLPRLIDAYARAAERDAVPPLVVAGAWYPRYSEARERAETLGRQEAVMWLGSIPEADLPTLYAAATAFVFPSLYEGFGLPPLEAMACGTPVACSTTSSLPEVVGDAALLFDPTDVESIALALRRISHDGVLRADLSARGLEQAARFSWERTARETLALYRKVAR
ncbi:MAG: glycosyltransferase family 4 protein [Anaerolineae bacterium]